MIESSMRAGTLTDSKSSKVETGTPNSSNAFRDLSITPSRTLE